MTHMAFMTPREAVSDAQAERNLMLQPLLRRQQPHHTLRRLAFEAPYLQASALALIDNSGAGY